MKKRAFMSIFVMVSFFFVSVVLGVTTLNDIKETDWFYENVKVLVEKEIIVGYKDGSFKPQTTMTADQFIKTMDVALGYNPGNAEGYWAQNYIDKAIELGIVIKGEFLSYTNKITRAEMARICERVVTKLEGNYDYQYESALEYNVPDRQAIADTTMKDAIYHMYEIGMITGYTDGSFKPNNALTRAEASTVIRRVIDKSIRKVPYELLASHAQIGVGDPVKDPGSYYFYVYIDMTKPMELQWKEAEAFLNDKVGKVMAGEILGYAKSKTSIRNYLEEKYWVWNKSKIQVISGGSNPIISISSW